MEKKFEFLIQKLERKVFPQMLEEDYDVHKDSVTKEQWQELFDDSDN